ILDEFELTRDVGIQADEMQTTCRVWHIWLQCGVRRNLPTEFASAPDDAMKAAGRHQILAQILMTKTEHADQLPYQALASTWHVAGARIGSANMSTERTTQPHLVTIVGELIASDIHGIGTDATDWPRAQGDQRLPGQLPSNYRLGKRDARRGVV